MAERGEGEGGKFVVLERKMLLGAEGVSKKRGIGGEHQAGGVRQGQRLRRGKRLLLGARNKAPEGESDPVGKGFKKKREPKEYEKREVKPRKKARSQFTSFLGESILGRKKGKKHHKAGKKSLALGGGPKTAPKGSCKQKASAYP